MTTTKGPVCIYCKHLRDDDTCAAFPEGIPDDILWGGALHESPREGDHGIRFEPIDDDSQRAYEMKFKDSPRRRMERIRTGL